MSGPDNFDRAIARVRGEEFVHPRVSMDAAGGITLREHLAGLALQGSLASGEEGDAAGHARYAVECADALLAALAVPR